MRSIIIREPQTAKPVVGMTKDLAIAEAKRVAKENNVMICVVHAPLDIRSGDEFDTGEYGYGPRGGIEILYKYGAIAAYVAASGDVRHESPYKPITSAENYANGCK